MNKRVAYLDILKTLAIIGIITTHTSGAITSSVTFSHLWIVGAFYDSFSRYGVPLFIIVTGSLTLGKNINIITFYKKAFFRIFIPLAFWSFIYYLYKLDLHISEINTIQFIKQFFAGNIYFHLWYLYMILGVYLSVPFLNKIILNTSKKEILLFFSISLIITVLYPFFHKLSGLNINFGSHIFIFAPSIFMLGYYLKNIHVTKKIFFISILFFITSSICAALGTIDLKETTLKYSTLYVGNSSPLIILQTISLFFIVKYFTKYPTYLLKITFFIGKFSLGIYIIHILIRDILLTPKSNLHHIFNLIHFPYLGVFLNTIIVLFFSSLTIYILSKIPILKRLI